MADRTSLMGLLRGFADTHRGIRLTVLFGEPAAFAGPRVFARVTSDGLLCRLPPGHRSPLVDPLPSGRWSRLRASDPERLTELLELAAAHVAISG